MIKRVADLDGGSTTWSIFSGTMRALEPSTIMVIAGI